MLNLMTLLVIGLMNPKPVALTDLQVTSVLNTAVLIRAKQYKVNSFTQEVEQFGIGCSGTYISSNTILTAGHCFENPTTEIWVKDPSQKRGVRAKLLKLDTDADLALLDVSSKTGHLYSKLADKAKLGGQVINVGSPFRFEFLLSEGVVASLGMKIKEYKSTYLISTAMINSGSSGGGAFNEKGELIGVNTMTAGGAFGWAGISMAVDLPSIREFLKPKQMPSLFSLIFGRNS
jgi:serine protease Do